MVDAWRSKLHDAGEGARRANPRTGTTAAPVSLHCLTASGVECEAACWRLRCKALRAVTSNAVLAGNDSRLEALSAKSRVVVEGARRHSRQLTCTTCMAKARG